MAKAYFVYDGKEYDGYELVSVFSPDSNNGLVYMDWEFEKRIFRNPPTNTAFVPQPGQKCFVASPCPLSFADIRSEYKVKRKVEDADFVVLPQRPNYCGWTSLYMFVAVESERKIYVNNTCQGYTLQDFITKLSSYIEDVWKKIDRDEIHVHNFSGSAAYELDLRGFLYEQGKYHIELYNNTLGKPAIDYTKLPFSNKNAMDVDTLYLLYKVGCESLTAESEKNLIIQLQALNQSDWRNHVGTTRLVLDAAMSHNTTGSQVLGSISRLPKGAKEMVKIARNHGISFDNDEDANMGRAFAEKILEFDPKKFSSIQEISKKIHDTKFPYAYFYELYDNIVKFRPKCITQ